MPGWLALLGTLALNFTRHRRGLPTICAVTRRTLPRPVFEALFDTGAAFLRAHVVNGYPTKET